MSVKAYVPGFSLWRVFPGLLLMLLALFAATPRAKADHRNDCDRRVARARWQLHEAIEHHGYGSRQARHWQHELREEYERCDRVSQRYRNERWRNGDRRDRGDDYRSYDEDRYRRYERDDYGRYDRGDRDDDY